LFHQQTSSTFASALGVTKFIILIGIIWSHFVVLLVKIRFLKQKLELAAAKSVTKVIIIALNLVTLCCAA
jgi:hypothetical protein